MAVKRKGHEGFITADAGRGAVSVGAKDIPFTDLEAVVVEGTRGEAGSPWSYGVFFAGGNGDQTPLLGGTGFGDARRTAVEFARECGLPIEDRTLGVKVVRDPDVWSRSFLERTDDGASRPTLPSPGPDLVATLENGGVSFHLQKGTLMRMLRKSWRKKRPPQSLGTRILGWAAMPIAIILCTPLLPVIAVAALIALHQNKGRGPVLSVSPTDGVRLLGMVKAHVPAAEVVDVEVAWRLSGEVLEPYEVLVRSDTEVITYNGSNESDPRELAWVRDWVGAVLQGR